MKKYIVAFLIGIVAFGFFKLKFNPESILLRHLEKRYNKEFVIAYGGKRSIGISSWYEAEIYPKELVGTPKEKDKYYWAKGFVENGKGGDTYGKVLLNESANNFYLPKLKELFGENVLPVLDLKGGYIEEDYVKEMELRNKLYKERPDGNFDPLSGGIYIFGRVESDEDREWYRKQIYEFVQFMKETGTFEYVDLDISIIEKNIMSDEFQNNTELKAELTKSALGQEYEKYRKERKGILEKYNFYTYNIDDIQDRISQINRSSLIDLGVGKWSVFNTLLYTKIYSPKYIENQNLDNEELKKYNKISDVKFYFETW
ncbi:hypothetical protein [uncultured Fusobacterium sp.]|uniref:hypothetical protein n=1 Tax=uncultured Fusobacterium sp. TaxID=159267 RepID=UPI0028059373|nr:hypothetical protein [uncultured Fusobacterium sp.]